MLAMKQIAKKIVSLIIALTMVVTILPQTSFVANAADVSGLTDTDIGISYKKSTFGTSSIVAAGTTVDINTTGANYSTSSITVTIKNNKAVEATLSFEYSLDIEGTGSVQIPKGTVVTENGVYSIELESGKSVEIYLVGAKNKQSTSVQLKNIKLVSESIVTATFKPSEHGYYTVDGKLIETEYTNTQNSLEAYNLKATPDAGYKFLGWYDETSKSYLSMENSVSLNIEKDSVITAKFIEENVAIFEVDKQYFEDLNDAVTYAQNNNINKITLIESGHIAGQYTIPEGITLLIPFDDAGTLYTTTPEAVQTAEAQSAYKTLTMDSGASITVNGALSVGGKHYASSQAHCCKPTGAYGHIVMNEGSSIVLNNGSNLYAWGYITGNGEVTAKSGSDVYEYFQITDWRGGSITSGMINNSKKVFPFSQYYVQNIESAVTFESGADEFAYVSVSVTLLGVQSATIPFIGDSGMFRLSENSTITKKYNPTTDRMLFSVNGDATVDSIAMKVGAYNIDSKNYILPINNNVGFEILSGTMTINNDMALLPGVSVKGAKGTTLKIASGASVYVYDTEQWSASYMNGASTTYSPVAYSPSGRGSRTISDAQIDVNGTLIAAGNIYTTAGGAKIFSSEGTGVYVQDGEVGTEAMTYQYVQSSDSYEEIPITAAKLQNADSSYVETANAKVGDVISYKDGVWTFPKKAYTVTWTNDDGTVLETDENVEEGIIPEYNGTTPSKESTAQYSYKFTGWTPAVEAITGDITYKATYEEILNQYVVTWKNWDGTVLATENMDYGVVPEYKGEDPVKEADAQYTYTFAGWTPAITQVEKDVTYTATFTNKVKTYTVIWKNDDGTELQKDENVAYGTTPSYTGTTPTKKADVQYTYTFNGWTPKVDLVTGDVTYTAVYEKTINEYTVTWKNWDGTELKSEEVKYGETPAWSGENPVKDDQEGYTYTFAGWTPEISFVTGDVTYTAKFDAEKKYYVITWVDEDGKTILEKDENVEYGTMPSYDGKIPEKVADNDFEYTFAGWTPELSKVTKDMTYKATYDKKEIIRYTVTFDANGGKGSMEPQEFVQGISGSLNENIFTREDYVFVGWNTNADGSGVSYSDQGAVMLQENITLYAQWKADFYQAVWLNDDGTELYKDEKVINGTTPEYKGETPVKEGDAQYSYTFCDWKLEKDETTGNVTYTAIYEKTINRYTVTWKNSDGTVLKTEALEYGTIPSWTDENPTKADEEGHTYTFCGWTPELEQVTGDVTYTAKYTDVLKAYTIKWVDEDGVTVLEIDENVVHGSIPTYDGETPVKEGDAQYSYTFSGWDKEIVSATSDIIYKAVYKATVNKYTVTWKNWDGTVLDSSEVAYGEMPVWSGKTPTKAEQDGYVYTFNGWTPEVQAVTGTAEYTAEYTSTLKTYTITWINDNGDVLETDKNVEYGTIPTYDGTTPEKEDNVQYRYEFAGWDAEIVAATSDMTYKATYTPILKQYTITWLNDDKTVLATESVNYGEVPEYKGDTPTKEKTAQYTYIFKGWTPEIKSVTGEATYTAMFTDQTRTYTVIWKNADGTELQKDENVSYGTTPEYKGETPVKKGNAQYTYEFSGWSPKVDAITGDTTYTAVYKEVVNKYTVIWKDWDGTELKTEEVEYGQMPVWSGDTPTKENTAQYTYTFKGWDPELSAVKKDVTYTAVYKEVVNKYTVTWKDWDGTELKKETVEYGTMPSYDGKTPEKATDDTYTYTFEGWTPELSEVKNDVIYQAVYKQTEIPKYNVSFDANGGTGTMASLIVVEGKEETLIKNQFTRDNYVFTGWNTKADGSGTAYAETAMISGLKDDVTLYAQWKIVNGLEQDGEDTYWVQNGERVLNAGLVQVKDSEGHNLYYYFAEDGKAVKNKPVGGNDYWITNTNDLLPEWGYYFDENGVIIHDELFQNGIAKDTDEILYYYIDGIKVHKGMFVIDGNYYYAKSNGALIVSASYYCSRTNDLKEEGTYSFDAEGKMILASEDKDGIVEENNSLYYYKDGSRYYAGLIKIGQDYYYVRTNGEVVCGKSYWISKTNDLLPEQSYTFGEDGKMVISDETKNGIVEEDGSKYYYENGNKIYAGLIEIDGEYYYVRSNGELVCDCTYWISKTNNLLPEQSYTFDADGKMVIADKTKNGIIAEDGTMYYYVNGNKTYAGLIEIDGAFYYVKSNGEVVHGKKYWITKTNGLLAEKSYTFAEDGKLME